MYRASQSIWKALLNLHFPLPSMRFTQLFFNFLGYIHLSLILNGSMEKVAMLILGVTEPHPIENIAFTWVIATH